MCVCGSNRCSLSGFGIGTYLNQVRAVGMSAIPSLICLERSYCCQGPRVCSLCAIVFESLRDFNVMMLQLAFEVFHSNQFSSLRCLCTDHSRVETYDFSCAMRTCGFCTSLKLRYPVQTSRDVTVMVPPDFSNNCSPYTQFMQLFLMFLIVTAL